MATTTTISSRENWIFSIVLILIVTLRLLKPEWWVVSYAAGIGFGINALAARRRQGKSWNRCVLIGLTTGIAIGLLVYLPPVLFGRR